MNEHSFALLFDENISYRIVKRILHLFPKSQAAKRLRLEAKEDVLIWDVAKTNGFTVITYDEDYELLNQVRGWPPKVILIRSGNLTNDQVVDMLEINFNAICDFLLDKDFDARGVLELYHIL
ncbi:DUF5615 family PIN-like protein [Spirosoma arcticum]